MASSNDQNPYAAVIADLESKRDELDRMIKNLRQMSAFTVSNLGLLGLSVIPHKIVADRAGRKPCLTCV